jgi:hypothetical protein
MHTHASVHTPCATHASYRLRCLPLSALSLVLCVCVLPFRCRRVALLRPRVPCCALLSCMRACLCVCVCAPDRSARQQRGDRAASGDDDRHLPERHVRRLQRCVRGLASLPETHVHASDALLSPSVFFFSWLGVYLAVCVPRGKVRLYSSVDGVTTHSYAFPPSSFPFHYFPGVTAAESKFYFIFFFAFLCLCLYFLLPLIFSSIYFAFTKKQRQTDKKLSRNRAKVPLISLSHAQRYL